MTPDLLSDRVQNGKSRVRPQVRITLLSVLLFGFFCHGEGLFNKLSHQDDIANLFTYGATITSGRWMLHLLSWGEDLLFGTGNAGLPLYNGLLTIFCVGAVCVLLVDLLRIRNQVYCALLGCLMVAFPMVTALFAYMFTSHPYMIGLLMTVICAYLICRDVPWWGKVLGVLLGGASVGVYQAFLPVMLATILIYDIMQMTAEIRMGEFLRRAGLQVLYFIGVMLVYFAGNRFFLNLFHLELSSYQGIDQMGRMTLPVFLERVGKAYSLFFNPAGNASADMYPGTLHMVYYLMLAGIGVLAIRRIILAGKSSAGKATVLILLYGLVPLGCNFIYVMSEDAHGLMVYGQAMLFVLLIAMLDELEQEPFRGRQAISLAASVVLSMTGVMYARFDNQCYLKDTLQQSEAMSYYTTLITRIKSHPGYHPEIEVCFLNTLSPQDPTIYNLEEMDFIQLNLYGHNTTEYIHYYKEFFMQKWCGFEANWYWGEELESWPEVQAMPAYPADGSIQIINDVLVVKF